jgi:sec-independent protein translocase protein TatA
VLLIVLTVILLVFGAKRVPQLGKSLGKGIREFREGVAEASREDDDATSAAELQTRSNDEGEALSPSEADHGETSPAQGEHRAGAVGQDIERCLALALKS